MGYICREFVNIPIWMAGLTTVRNATLHYTLLELHLGRHKGNNRKILTVLVEYIVA
jgi:hypothetical protein